MIKAGREYLVVVTKYDSPPVTIMEPFVEPIVKDISSESESALLSPPSYSFFKYEYCTQEELLNNVAIYHYKKVQGIWH